MLFCINLDLDLQLDQGSLSSKVIVQTHRNIQAKLISNNYVYLTCTRSSATTKELRDVLC